MRRVVISGMIGNGLEWYDYALYGLLTPVIAKLFFPTGDPVISLIATFGVFAAGFAMRPVGAILFGYIGDKYGRRVSLVLSILMMAIPTACIGFLPTYQMIGIAAPILLTFIRLLQGLSLGGAFSGSIAFIVEHAPDKHRGSAGATTLFSMVLGILAGSGISALLAYVLTPAQFELFGWRIPFIIGVAAGIVGFYIRHHVDESPKYLQAKEDGALSSRPLRDIFAHHKSMIMQAIGIYMLVTAPFYILAVFMVTFTEKMLHHPKSEALFINTINMVILLICIPIFAPLSDKIGRKPLLMLTAVLFLVLIGPIFWLMCQPTPHAALYGQMCFAVLVGMYIGPVPAMLVESFPTSVRYTGMAVSYNICAAVFGGTAPLVSTWLIHRTEDIPSLLALVTNLLGSPNAVVALYIMVCAVVAIIALSKYQDHYDVPLR